MFRCTEGHLANQHDQQHLVPTKARSVRYHVWATDKAGLTVLLNRSGTEVVEEKVYCLAHRPTTPPTIVGHVERTHRFDSKRSYQNMRRWYGLDDWG